MNRKLESVISFFINVLSFGYWYVRMKVHQEMTEEYSERSANASYSEFKDAFNKIYYWSLCGGYKSLFYDYDGKHHSEFHASIICIDRIGFKLTSFGYIRALILRNKKINQLNREIIREVGMWQGN